MKEIKYHLSEQTGDFHLGLQLKGQKEKTLQEGLKI